VLDPVFWQIAEQDLLDETVIRRIWTWIGHSHMKADSSSRGRVLRGPVGLQVERMTEEYLDV